MENEKIEVETSKTIKGNVTLFSKGFWKKDTPTTLAILTKAARYFTVGIIGLIAASDLFTAHQSKVITLILSAFILFLGSIDLAVGVEPEDKNK